MMNEVFQKALASETHRFDQMTTVLRTMFGKFSVQFRVGLDRAVTDEYTKALTGNPTDNEDLLERCKALLMFYGLTQLYIKCFEDAIMREEEKDEQP